MKELTLHKAFLLIISILQIFIVNYNIRVSTMYDGYANQSLLYGIFLVMTLAVAVFYWMFLKIKIKSIFTKFYLLWTMYVILNLLFIPSYYINNNATNSIISLALRLILESCPLFLFLFFYAVFSAFPQINGFFKNIVVVLTVVIALLIFNSYNIIQTFVIKDSLQFGTSYYIIFMLPFVLFLRNKLIKNALIVLIAVVLLMSLKRGGIIAMGMALLLSYIIQNIFVSQSKLIIKKVFTILLFIGITVGFFYLFDCQYNNGEIVERIENIQEDEGSGRTKIYEAIWQGINKSSLVDLCFGNGYYATVRGTSLYVDHNSYKGMTAHNDFLEVLYDYGIIGLLLYLWFYILMFKLFKQLIKQRSEYVYSVACMIVLFAVLSMVSHIIIYHHFQTVAIFFGVIEGISRSNKYY